MSTKTLQPMRVQIAEPLYFLSSSDHVGWLPSTYPLKSTETESNIFYPAPGIAPLGYMCGGTGSGEISFRPIEDADIPVDSTITGLTFRVRCYRNDGLRPDELARTTGYFYRIITTTLTLPTPVEDAEEFPTSVFEPTKDAVEYEFDMFDETGTATNGWTFDRQSALDASIFLTRYGLMVHDYDPKNPVVVTNAELDVEFELPEPEIVAETPVSWTITSGNQDMAWEFFGPISGGITIPAGTYTDGQELADLIQELIDTMPVHEPYPTDTATFEYNEGRRAFRISFQFGPHEFYGSALTSLGFESSYTQVWYAQTSAIPSASPIISDIRPRTARMHGSINPNGATSAYPVTAYVQYYVEGELNAVSTTATQTLTGNTALPVMFEMTDLVPGLDYTCQIIAENADHRIEGAIATFTTASQDIAVFED